ncbi:serine/threonine-protein kinase grp [Stomoxys calcitrans]|uniref:serine/threonine-protein kinase grp n=1 Tax=Stomoxys calcitrans TaxID=35570 RepID=UPI0027E21E0D|nr:serine/threonine-protein kinase grp [Stomoxys calcitrans]XP_013100951.2 serine/threonine-protein kinase grp [Stomoxys calcitrans]XP_059220222.1 serine/threonine-protein kinase grp [Stomoxys calcitrans]
MSTSILAALSSSNGNGNTNGNSTTNNGSHNSSNGNGNREFVEGWTLAQTLGEGAYGEVKLLINRQTGEAVAMKMVDLKKHSDAIVSVRKEICIQKMLQDQHILRFFGNRSHGHIEYIFLEYAAGGELFDRIEPDIGMPQHEAQRYFTQLLSGMQYLHQRGITHRDLKPENLLLDEHDNIKISDFGMATMFRCKGKERLLDKRCGTLPYVAPEVLLKPYHAQPADIWSCGIILVTMLAGELPWDEPSVQCQEFINWKDNDRWTTQTPWSKLDTLAISLLRKVLATNPTYRMTLDKIMSHKWCNMEFIDSDRSRDLVDSAAALEIRSPKAKRQRQMSSHHSTNSNPNIDDTISRNYCSQPLPVFKHDFEAPSNPEEAADHPAAREHRLGFCFSQPAMLDDLLLCTQMNQTQSASQNLFQRLVRRMTRFFVTMRQEETIKRLVATIEKLGYTWKICEDNLVVTITTIDRRKLHLVFKAHIIEMDGKILLDFRLSKGCGLEFKRRFIKIKQLMEDVVLKGPVTWPIAIATNCVP